MIDILCAFKALKTTNKKQTFSVDVNCIWNKKDKQTAKQQLKPYKNKTKKKHLLCSSG